MSQSCCEQHRQALQSSLCKNLCFSLFVCLLVTMPAAAQPLVQTGWSNGRQPDPSRIADLNSYVKHLCPLGSFVDSFMISQADVLQGSNRIPSIGAVQAKCSNGNLLRPVGNALNRAQKIVPSSSGFPCFPLTGRNTADNGWMIGFLGVGETSAGTELRQNCGSVPTGYVVVGYEGVSGAAVDAINFIMAPKPGAVQSPSPSPFPSPSPSPAQSPSPSPPTPTPSPSPKPDASVLTAAVESLNKHLSTPVIAGAVAGSVVGVTALIVLSCILLRCCRRRRAARAHAESDLPHAMPADWEHSSDKLRALPADVQRAVDAAKGVSRGGKDASGKGGGVPVVMIGRCLDVDDGHDR